MIREGEALKLWDAISRAMKRACCIGVSAVLLLAALPAAACARASADAVDIKTVAQVQTDGSLHVVEQRIFVFDTSAAELVWPLTSMEEDSKLEVASVRYAHCTLQGGIDGEWTSLAAAPFMAELRDATRASSAVPESPSFCVDNREGELYLFFAPLEGRVVFECDYTITDVVRAFDDIAELYWDYVPADAEATAQSVSASVRLPLPEGMEAVAGQNVFAWGHGAQGTVNVKADGTISFAVPEVRPGQYAQAHVLFPQQWLTNLSFEAQHAHAGTRLDDAKAEEEDWTDTWSAWLVNSYTLDLTFVAVGIIAIAAALALYFSFGREPKLHGQVSAGACKRYEAPLIGRLLKWDHASPANLVCLIVQLVERRAITVEALSEQGPLGPGFEDLRIRTGAHAKDVARTPVDQEALKLLFDVWGEGYGSVTLTDIAKHAVADKERFRQELASFAQVLTGEVSAAGFFDARSARVQRGIIIAGCVLCAGALLFGVAGGSFVRGTALIIAGVACLVIGNYTGRRTEQGVAVEASALKLADACASVPAWDLIPESDVPYACAMQCLPKAAADQAPDDGSFAALWLRPRKGRGGRPEPCLAQQLADQLERWS